MRKFTGKTIRETKNTRVGGESLEKCMSPHLLTACMLVPFLFFCRAADGTGSLMNFVVCPKQGIFGGLCDTQTNMMQLAKVYCNTATGFKAIATAPTVFMDLLHTGSKLEFLTHFNSYFSNCVAFHFCIIVPRVF